MARGSGRGGNQPPQKPAAVSGPGALSQRTDGGPGSDTQPIRVPTGGNYGEGKALADAQRAAPLPDRTPPDLPGGGTASVSPAAASPGGVFGPTQRPGESPLTGAVGPAALGAMDPDTVIRLMYSVFPHPQLLRLIRGR